VCATDERGTESHYIKVLDSEENFRVLSAWFSKIKMPEYKVEGTILMH
jgi:hypothetical protein